MATCFVIMGFGKKPDYSVKARTLDLDATFEAIIKPAVRACGLECIRADEICHSGVIDKPMYQLLLDADLVIADISTANPNALYELGVRHALRPFATIVMKEQDGKFIFDLNHVATFQYKHLGEDIGTREAKEKRTALEKLIKGVMAKPSPDSPVYTFLNDLKGPTMTRAQLQAALEDVRDKADSLSDEIAAGRLAAAESRSADARDHFQRACAMQRAGRAQGHGTTQAVADDFLVQQLALHTYKAGAKGTDSVRKQALEDGWQVIEQLSPDSSLDPETLGIAGAIRQRLFKETGEIAHLEAAVEMYGRGFALKHDYYNGENYATCLDRRAETQTDPAEADYDRRTAFKVRQRTIASLEPLLADSTTSERSDYKWMLATMSNTLRWLGRDGDEWERKFRELKPAQWEIETFENGKKVALGHGGQRSLSS